MPFFITDDNVKLYYDDRGAGKPVILIHGWSCSRHHFKKQVPELKKNYRVITYDLRGHGDSDAPEKGLTLPRFANDLKQLIEHLELKDVSLVGWSMGTSIIFEYVKQYGCENLGKLCLIDMTPKLITDDEWKIGLYGDFDLAANLDVLNTLTSNWDEFSQVFIPGVFSKKGCKNEEDLNWMLQEVKKNTIHVLVNMWIAMAVSDYREVLPNISVPCLITYGEESCLYLAENSKYMNDKISNSTLDAFPGCGHALFFEDPDKFNKDLVEFLG